MKQHTLWSAVDVDRSRWWQYGAYIALCVVLLVAFIWFWAWTGFRGDGARPIIRSLGLLLPAALLPFARKRAVRNAMQYLGAFPAPAGSFAETREALSDFSIASGETMPELWVFRSDAINAIGYREQKTDRIAVTTTFALLPVDEQRAGIAMLLSREMLKVDSIVLSSKTGVPTDKNGNSYRPTDLNNAVIRARVVSSWLEAAGAGDRQALMLIRDPKPMLMLLKRLAIAPTALPLVSLDAGYGCLAWPFGEKAATDQHLPPKAREALAQLVAQGASAGARPEVTRLARLQQVLPAGEREAPEPEPIVPPSRAAVAATGGYGARPGVGATGGFGAVPAFAGLAVAVSATAAGAQPAYATAAGNPYAAGAVALASPYGAGAATPFGQYASQPMAPANPYAAGMVQPMAAPQPPTPSGASAVGHVTGPRIAKICPSCGANNISTNRACIACGKALPKVAPVAVH